MRAALKLATCHLRLLRKKYGTTCCSTFLGNVTAPDCDSVVTIDDIHWGANWGNLINAKLPFLNCCFWKDKLASELKGEK